MGESLLQLGAGGDMRTTTRVALVDEYEAVRAGLESWVAAESRLITAAAFADPVECVDWLRSSPPVDVVVAEIQHDGRAPDLGLLHLMCAAAPAVVVHARASSDEVILGSIEAGAISYVCKSEGRDHLVGALLAAGKKDRYLAPRLGEALGRGDSAGRIGLSEREKEVLVAWLKTESKDDVAYALHIAPATVRTHLQRIRIKYAQAARPAPTKSALLARAIEDGIIGLADLDDASFSRPAAMIHQA